MVYSRTERVFIREYYIASKSFAAVHEEFSNAYPNKKIPSKTRKCRMITKFRETGSFYRRQVLIEQPNAGILALPISNGASTEDTEFSSKTSILFSSYCV
jgi:hypothetical protein